MKLSYFSDFNTNRFTANDDVCLYAVILIFAITISSNSAEIKILISCAQSKLYTEEIYAGLIKSFLYMINKSGPRINLWGTPL